MRKDDTPDDIRSRAIVQRALLDQFADMFRLKNDAAIARMMETQPPVISKWSSGKLAIGSCAIIRIHEMTGWSTTQIKQILGLPVAKRRV